MHINPVIVLLSATAALFQVVVAASSVPPSGVATFPGLTHSAKGRVSTHVSKRDNEDDGSNTPGVNATLTLFENLAFMTNITAVSAALALGLSLALDGANLTPTFSPVQGDVDLSQFQGSIVNLQHDQNITFAALLLAVSYTPIQAAEIMQNVADLHDALTVAGFKLPDVQFSNALSPI